MAAAGNYQHCQESMDDTFYLTNVVPQNMNNNERSVKQPMRMCMLIVTRLDIVCRITGIYIYNAWA